MIHCSSKNTSMRATYFVVLQPNNLGRRFCTSKMHYPHPSCLGCCPFKSDVSVVVVVVAVVESLFMLLPLYLGILCLVLVSLFGTLCLYIFAIILMRKLELVDLLVACLPCVL